MTTPTWIDTKAVTITKTVNGYAVSATPNAPASELVAFETFQSLIQWLDTRWDAP